MVRALLAKLEKFLHEEKEFLGKLFPGGDEDGKAGVSHREMESTLRRFRDMEKGYLDELVGLAADKAKEKELWRELAFLQELYQKREENIALGREKLGHFGKELDRVRAQKKVHSAYHPAQKGKEAGFVDGRR